MASNLDNLQFDNRFFNELPADPEPANFRRQVTAACYSTAKPSATQAPQLVAYSKEVAELIGLDEESCQSEQFTELFSGNGLLNGMQPYAQCYGGHQFGNWAGQLGDGRAINLGEVVNLQGEHWTLQLKGAGPTPYSRSADGLAVLRSSVREFLCSEAMFHLGVPTTRALSLTLTGDQVVRDMFYDGSPKQELGAVVCRVAPSFTRFGNFQLPASRGDIKLLKQLVDFTIRSDFSHLGEPGKECYLAWFKEVCQKTAEMVIHWQRVGFVHGVMNTDNMSILGLTIDYGPYGWLEDYDPDWTPNTTDAGGRRYRFSHQPQIAQWNLVQLANAIYPLVEEAELLQASLTFYVTHFDQGWYKMMASKLGLTSYQGESDKQLISELLELLKLVETDMTIFFRKLSDIDCLNPSLAQANNKQLIAPLLEAYYQPEALTDSAIESTANWLHSYFDRVRDEKTDYPTRRTLMNSVNPKYVLRNYMAQLAIDDAEQGDFSVVNELLELLRHPYDEQPAQEKWAAKRPDWARDRAGCSMLSCSS
jgi:uncharacterized protein YdiU (UPF0061 family)